MDASYIDQVNILQATFHGMALSTQALVHMHHHVNKDNPPTPRQLIPLPHIQTNISYHDKACVSVRGCYVVTSKPLGLKSLANQTQWEQPPPSPQTLTGSQEKNNAYYALVDGNRMPLHMPCPAETMTKGDGREYSIAAASIVAKVLRDNLMRQYHDLYPTYNLQQHKGYPTAAHMAMVRENGAITPIHRRSFQPLKSMLFDEAGKVLESEK